MSAAPLQPATCGRQAQFHLPRQNNNRSCCAPLGLQRRKQLLEQVLEDGSVVAVLQRLTSQALTLVRSPCDLPPEGMEFSSFSTCLDALPGSLQGESSCRQGLCALRMLSSDDPSARCGTDVNATIPGYNDAVLARMACMTLGDHVNVYKSFLSK